MDLVATEFSFGTSACDHDRTPGCIDLNSMLEGCGSGEKKELLQHFNDVVVGMKIVIP